MLGVPPKIGDRHGTANRKATLHDDWRASDQVTETPLIPMSALALEGMLVEIDMIAVVPR
jgi:hypothetical protein